MYKRKMYLKKMNWACSGENFRKGGTMSIEGVGGFIGEGGLTLQYGVHPIPPEKKTLTFLQFLTSEELNFLDSFLQN